MKVLTFLACMLFSFCVYSQKQRNYVYVFDCTGSMKTDFHIWDPAKQWLKEDISRKNDNAMITVVPFRDNADDAITFRKADMNWDALEDRFNTLISSPHRNTGICRAWDTAVKYMQKGKDNFFIVLTDGADIHAGADCVKSRMHGWCGTHPDSYGYVVTLSKNAKEALWTDLTDCDNIDIIDGTGHIPRIGTFTGKRFSMLSHAIRNFKTGFSECETYKAHIKCNDPYYDIKLKDNQLVNNTAIFEVSKKSDPESIHEVKFEVISDDPNLKLCSPNFVITVDPRNLANLDFDKAAGDEYDGGEIDTYSDFLFFNGKDKERASINLGTVFNQRAKEKNCTITMSAQLPKELAGNCKLYLNGKEVNPSAFDITSASDSNILDVELTNDAPDDNFVITLAGKSDNLESINAEQVKTYNATVHVDHDIDWHPVKTFLFWLAIVIMALLILWFVVLKWIFYPTFKVSSIMITDPYYSSIRLKGVRKVIFTNKRLNQSFLNKLFTGTVLCNVNPCWTKPLVMEPAKKKIRVQRNKTYVFDPFGGQLNRQTEYVVDNTETNEKIKMTIN